MTTKAEQKLIDKWIKIYKKESDADLRLIYHEEFEYRSTPRRTEDKARKKAIEALVGNPNTSDPLPYTKGEWEIRGNRIFLKGKSKSIATIHIVDSWDKSFNPIQDVEAEANAKLLNASPDMYEAIKENLAWIDKMGITNDSVRKLRKAINKAQNEKIL